MNSLLSGLRLPATLAFTALLGACGSLGGGKMIGSGPLVPNQRMVTEFSEIESDGPISYTIRQGETQSVIVNAQSDAQAFLTTSVKGDKLTVETKGKLNDNAGTNIEITVRELKSISADGSGMVEIMGFDGGKKLNISKEGSGGFRLSDVRYESLDITADGSGDIRVTGNGDNFSIKSQGSGTIDAADYDSRDVKVDTNGSGDVRVSASDDLSIKLSGSGNVYYRGNPKLSLEDKGSGEARAEN